MDQPEVEAIAQTFRETLNLISGPLDIILARQLSELHLQTVSSRPALLVTVDTREMTAGPLIQAGRSVCWKCLAHWTATAAWDPVPWMPPSLVARQRAAAVLKTVASQLENDATAFGLTNRLLSVDLETGRTAAHPIYPLRDCPDCSKVPDIQAADSVTHCSRLTGIVREVEVTAEPAGGIYLAIGTFVHSLPVANARPQLRAQTCVGRGATAQEAQDGCIGEALERYSLVYRGDEPLRRARLGDLPAIDPRKILLYSDAQFATRELWNASADERYFVGEPFDDAAATDWVAARDLTSGSTVWAPAACTLMWYQFREGEPQFARADSIGCASGKTYDDALAGALLEWVERDSMAIWWYNRVRRPGLDLESLDDPRLDRVREGLGRMGRSLHLLDVTTEIGIPAYVAIAPRLDGSEPVFAGAAHLSPRIAAWKAASEVAQIWVSIVHRHRADPEIVSWLRQANTAEYDYLQPSCLIPAPAEPEAMPATQQVAQCVERLQGAGLRPAAVDLSRSDVVLHTVRAIVPGLRHIWNRKGPGRLYDVPVQMGWLPEALPEEGLNSICCMI